MARITGEQLVSGSDVTSDTVLIASELVQDLLQLGEYELDKLKDSHMTISLIRTLSKGTNIITKLGDMSEKLIKMSSGFERSLQEAAHMYVIEMQKKLEEELKPDPNYVHDSLNPEIVSIVADAIASTYSDKLMRIIKYGMDSAVVKDLKRSFINVQENYISNCLSIDEANNTLLKYRHTPTLSKPEFISTMSRTKFVKKWLMKGAKLFVEPIWNNFQDYIYDQLKVQIKAGICPLIHKSINHGHLADSFKSVCSHFENVEVVAIYRDQSAAALKMVQMDGCVATELKSFAYALMQDIGEKCNDTQLQQLHGVRLTPALLNALDIGAVIVPLLAQMTDKAMKLLYRFEMKIEECIAKITMEKVQQDLENIHCDCIEDTVNVIIDVYSDGMVDIIKCGVTETAKATFRTVQEQWHRPERGTKHAPQHTQLDYQAIKKWIKERLPKTAYNRLKPHFERFYKHLLKEIKRRLNKAIEDSLLNGPLCTGCQHLFLCFTALHPNKEIKTKVIDFYTKKSRAIVQAVANEMGIFNLQQLLKTAVDDVNRMARQLDGQVAYSLLQLSEVAEEIARDATRLIKSLEIQLNDIITQFKRTIASVTDLPRMIADHTLKEIENSRSEVAEAIAVICSEEIVKLIEIGVSMAVTKVVEEILRKP